MLNRCPSGVVAVETKASTAAGAAAELASVLPASGLAAVLVFVSPCYDPQRFAAEMAARFNGTPVFGCTTAGEIALNGWDDNSIVALAFSAADFDVTAHPILGLSDFRIEDNSTLGPDIRHRFFRQDGNADGERCFGLLLIDGMCQREEVVLAAVYASLDHIPLVGGSAADGLRFERSWVYFGGRAHTDAAVLLVFRTSLPFLIFSCDTWEPSTEKMVVTEADPDRRTVSELNAEPAAAEYSRMAGLAGGVLDVTAFASHPVLVRIGDAYYARSIRRIDADGTLHFAAAIDKGLVFTVATLRDPIDPTSDLFAQIHEEIGEVALYIGFESVQRRLGVEHQCDRDMSELYRAHRVFGCNTYGELYGPMHINGTLTGVAIGTPRVK
ncbi:FIST N-terminal domain-containing protein [Bradyrhizobium sp. BR 10261]|uniref:FIST N-terminal domain-containing protein n=1 Tax=Bradyrhizobium sp. BR 10261 TaxID=2749992 RepID=UPI001C64C714|nr:FIST N-terminal domain-containing protein [Bradyrhizobium sp. BR 10261]MBW7965973.1 FIST C-terminal domain-containing protein [Bradyrhizobium sp. BR 10261]